MILLKRLADLPRDTRLRCKTSVVLCEDADYVYFHKSLNFYSCYFNNTVVESKGKDNKDAVLHRRKKKQSSNKE